MPFNDVSPIRLKMTLEHNAIADSTRKRKALQSTTKNITGQELSSTSELQRLERWKPRLTINRERQAGAQSAKTLEQRRARLESDRLGSALQGRTSPPVQCEVAVSFKKYTPYLNVCLCAKFIILSNQHNNHRHFEWDYNVCPSSTTSLSRQPFTFRGRAIATLTGYAHIMINNIT